MADKRLTFTSWFLIMLAALLSWPIGALIHWGGRIESTLLIFGEPVFVVVDASRPRIWLLFALPALLAAGAVAARLAGTPR
jgi:hypothetical protein